MYSGDPTIDWRSDTITFTSPAIIYNGTCADAGGGGDGGEPSGAYTLVMPAVMLVLLLVF